MAASACRIRQAPRSAWKSNIDSDHGAHLGCGGLAGGGEGELLGGVRRTEYGLEGHAVVLGRADGTPLSVAVPLLSTSKDTSGGRVPDNAIATDEDDTEVVTVKESDWFSGNVADVGEVNARTDKVAFWVTGKPTPLEAPNVMG